MIYFVVLMMVELADTYETGMQMVIYYTGLLVTGSIFAMRYFSSLARTGSALTLLMQPVSVFEKWLLSALTILIIYPLIYTVIFEVMTLPVTWLSKQYTLAIDYKDASDLLNVQLFIPLTHINQGNSSIEVLPQFIIWIIYAGITAYAITSSVLFKRLAPLKTIVFGFILSLIFLFIIILIKVFESSTMVSLGYWFFVNEANRITVISFIANFLLWIAAPLLMWAASFFALKERDL